MLQTTKKEVPPFQHFLFIIGILQPQDSRCLQNADLGFGIRDFSGHDVFHERLQRDCVDIQELICVQMAIRGSSPVPPSPLSCIGLTAIGLLSSIAFALMTSGVRAVGSTKASFASMLEPVTSVLCGILFFSEPLKGGTLPGLILILISMKIIAGPGQQKLSDRRAHRYNFR